MKTLATAHGSLALPAFLPDATRAAIRSADAQDVAATGIEALMVNALHLGAQPGTSLIEQAGGIHVFMGWDRPIASDSGGFQAFSLVTAGAALGSVTDDGFIYRTARGASKKTLDPEKSIRHQLQLGADILFCLDHCTHPDADAEAQRASVEHTVRWAERCKAEFAQRVDSRAEGRPLLFAVIQGGRDAALRQTCAERLLEIGFDGYGFGGWPVRADGGLEEAVAQVAELLPASIPKHALGIGKPENLVAAHRLGYDLFDCTIPTRDARHARLYVFEDAPVGAPSFYSTFHVSNEPFARDNRPIDGNCDCLCCRHYSRAYIHHLFKSREVLAQRLATIHNLRFYARLIQERRTHGRECS
ncbi:MAG TPA: tRNA guanosine(34) transglycosylase Tgt [Candidatus Hydrogenedentes bacterium]|mgnify:CR=1 FL=1|nr:tRNA guanosine(34) transglycosylase Tgt [Candidatus Hydrogenedentota bacterium]